MRSLLATTTAALLLAMGVMTAAASTTTTPASGGTNVSADLAQNGVAPAFTTLGAIVITEASNNDFRTSGTLVLTAPSGWQFNPAAAVTATPGKVAGGSTPIDISASVGAITASSITINITVNATARLDNLTISGIQVQTPEGGVLPAAGNILRSSANPGTATITGVSNDVTNFGSLSQGLGALRLFVVLPGQSFTDGATVAASGLSGVAPNQAAGVAFDVAELVAADREFNVASTYSGAKTIAWSGAGGSPSYTTNVSFTGGHSTTALATTLRKAETLALSATSATVPAIATALPSSSFAVDAGPATRLQVLLPGETAAPGTASGKTGSPAAQVSGVAIANNVRVNAVDANWNVVGSATPDVAIGSSDGAAAIADDNGAADGNLSLVAGSGTLSSFTFWTGGAMQTLSATDVAAALSAGASANVTVNKPASATGVTSSQNPATFGQSVTFTATVTGANGTPTGTVDFKDGASVIAGAVALDGSGVASFTPASLTAATHTISAVYSGSGVYSASTSANLSQVVSKAGTATALASSLNPSCPGQQVTLTATVSAVAPGAGVPAGTVNFKDGTTVIGNAIALNGSGVATFTTSALSTANHNLTAVYNGSGSFNTSSSTVLVQAIKAKPTAVVSGSTSICPGGSANIQAALGGTAPWTVTWSDGVVQSGIMASPASRSVSPAATTIYSVSNVADASCSNIGSGSATVTLNSPPAITAQPSAKSVCDGSSATFSVAATGTGITYQWRKDGVNLVNGGHVAGATSANLTINPAMAADAGSYDVVVSGTCPPAQASIAASLTVRPRPSAVISADAQLCPSSTGNGASVADAGAGASYAWTISGGIITAGAGSPSITFNAGSSGSSTTLNVTITQADGCGSSGSKIIPFKPKPTAVVSGSTSICPGGSANIQAALGGTAPWTVTWSDGMVQSGVVSSPAVRSASPAATTVYTVTSVVDAYCSNVGSGSATVTVNALPAISAQPSPRSVCEGNSTTFTVAASGTGITYRWRKDGVNLVNAGHVSGATSATLTISSAAAADAGSYDVVVSGTCPPAQTSNAVSLTVNPRPVATITADSKVCVGSAGNVASVADAGPGASYAWSIGGGAITAGAGTPSIVYTAPSSGNSLTLNVTVTSVNGCATSGSKAVAVSTGNVVIEDWKNIPRNDMSWQSSTLSANDQQYPEGGTIPYRVTMPQPCVGGTWSITLQYDFRDVASGVHFCDFLTSYNAYEGYVNGRGCDGDTCISQSTFPIPADPELSFQKPGVFTALNGTITSVSGYSIDLSGGINRKFVTVSGTATPDANVMLLFGAHLARDYEWGNNMGAHEWPHGTASMGWIDYSGSGAGSAGLKNVKITDNILDSQSQSDFAVVMTDSPDPVNAGQNLSYSIQVNNTGPLASAPDTLTDVIPAGTKFVSATAPAGWTMTTPAVGGTGTVRWILPTSFAADASASFELVVNVNSGSVGTVENTATLAAASLDDYLPNNSAHTSTYIFGTCTMPTAASDPANVTVVEGAYASFSVSPAGSPAPAIQWQVMPMGGGSFGDLSGETGATLVFPAGVAQNGNQYRARISNTCGTQYSAAATLTVVSAGGVAGDGPNPTEVPRLPNGAPQSSSCIVPAVTSDPANATVVEGDTASFSVSASGSPAPAIQWQVMASGGVGFSNLTGAIGASLRFPAVLIQNGNQYRARISNSCGTVYSAVATLTVTPVDVSDLNPTEEPRLARNAPGAGTASVDSIGRVNAQGLGAAHAAPVVDLEFRMAQNAPNPFRSATLIHFSMPQSSHVKLTVFDVAGRQVVTLSDQEWGPGMHTVSWSGTTASGAPARGGLYIIQMVANATNGSAHFRAQKTMIRIE